MWEICSGGPAESKVWGFLTERGQNPRSQRQPHRRLIPVGTAGKATRCLASSTTQRQHAAPAAEMHDAGPPAGATGSGSRRAPASRVSALSGPVRALKA